MILQQLLGPFPAARFLEQHYFRLPHSRPGGAAEFVPLGSWQVVDAILGDATSDAWLARKGERFAGPRPTPGQARTLHADGWTLVIRDAQKHHPRLATLAADFAADFSAPVNIHLYCTPASQHGFNWHYDVEDVFILQCAGAKAYRLRKNTVNPWPVLESMPKDLRYEREVTPTMECALRAGDWLYIPAGWWHVAPAEEDSISLAVGMMSPTVLEVLDFLRARAPHSVVWRQRLPAPEASAALFAELGKDLARELADPAFTRAFIEHRRPR